MKITTMSNLNLDMVCFLNVATGDKFYTKVHKKEYKMFYPLLSDDIKEKISKMVAKRETTRLGPSVALLISSLEDYKSRDLVEMLQSHDEIRKKIALSPYYDDDLEKKLPMHFETFTDAVIPFVKELNDIGFVAYWDKVKKPLLDKRCSKLNNSLKKFNILDEINKLMPFNDADIRMWICAFARPHGIKLCGYDMIADYRYYDKTILSIITHEMFHPPYKLETVTEAVEKLGNIPWVIKAYNEQRPGYEYKPMSGFIEENIVEALGIFVLKKMYKYYNAHRYFKKHDYGSHVISPYFYDYLHNTPKNQEQSFEEYFINFVDALSD